MNLGTIAVVAEGEYNPLKAYKKLRLVSLEGSSYYTLMATNRGESPVSHPEKWMVSGLKGDRGNNANPIFGKATQNNAPDPDPAYKRYNVVEPITTGSAWGIEVTQTELDANRVFFDVENGVVTKFVTLKRDGIDGKSTYDLYLETTTDSPPKTLAEFTTVFEINNEVIPTEIIKAVNGKAVSSYVEDNKFGESILLDPSFNKGFVLPWRQNGGLTITEADGILSIDSNGIATRGIYQIIPAMSNGDYLGIIKIKNISGGTTFRFGIYTYKKFFDVPNSTEFVTYLVKFEKTDTANLVVLEVPTISQVEVDSVYVIKKENPMYNMLLQDSKTTTLNNSISIINNNISSISSQINSLEFLPKKGYNKSPFYDKLQPFFDKMLARTQDVTLVQIGDSITTDLDWTDKRLDANERPPFCTEFDINSNLEEKLRWKEQKYRRFDYSGIFTEILGGGTSRIINEDTNWYLTGAAYQLPITKVITGGSGSGVSFEMPATMKRLSFIVHSDSQFATATKVTISSGSGKVQVFDGTNWIEAHNYITTFKETELISGTSSVRNNPHTRLKFRCTTDLTAKVITIANIGTGRFGYWGIEYSTKEFMFTYICAGKGSHNIEKLRKYEAYTVDAFNPDLVLQQCCILSHSVGNTGRINSTEDIVALFENYYDDLIAKGYLVMPFILWVRGNGGFIDTNGNYTNCVNGATGKIFTVFDDIFALTKMYENKSAPVLNLFSRITEVAIEKAKIEGTNMFDAAMEGSGKSGNTFTVDAIHLNELGNKVCFNMLNEYFNF